MPKIHYYGERNGIILMVTDFIEGKVYEEYNEMPSEVIHTLVNQVKQLHKLNILHGDLRAPNFIVREDKTVAMIDFGRSKFATQSELEQEMKQFLSELDSAQILVHFA